MIEVEEVFGDGIPADIPNYNLRPTSVRAATYAGASDISSFAFTPISLSLVDSTVYSCSLLSQREGSECSASTSTSTSASTSTNTNTRISTGTPFCDDAAVTDMTRKQQELDGPPATLYLFLYGTLTDPHVLAYSAQLTGKPYLSDASIAGYKLMRWGAHPTLVPGGDLDVVHGKMWACTDPAAFRRLQLYNTSMYAHAACAIEVHNGPAVGRLVPGRTFCWPDARDPARLVEVRGTWDLDAFRRSDMYRLIRGATVWADVRKDRRLRSPNTRPRLSTRVLSA